MGGFTSEQLSFISGGNYFRWEETKIYGSTPRSKLEARFESCRPLRRYVGSPLCLRNAWLLTGVIWESNGINGRDSAGPEN